MEQQASKTVAPLMTEGGLKYLTYNPTITGQHSYTQPPAWLNIDCTTNQVYLLSHIFTLHMLKTHAYIGNAPKLSQFSSIWVNDKFAPGIADGGFKQWAGKGKVRVK